MAMILSPQPERTTVLDLREWCLCIEAQYCTEHWSDWMSRRRDAFNFVLSPWSCQYPGNILIGIFLENRLSCICEKTIHDHDSQCSPPPSPAPALYIYSSISRFLEGQHGGLSRGVLMDRRNNRKQKQKQQQKQRKKKNVSSITEKKKKLRAAALRMKIINSIWFSVCLTVCCM